MSPKTILFAIAVVGGCAGVWFWVNYEGQKSVLQLARKTNLCKTEICQEGTSVVYDAMTAKYNVSRMKIDWCLGVEELSQIKVRKGGWIKSMLVETAYWPCGVFSNSNTAS